MKRNLILICGAGLFAILCAPLALGQAALEKRISLDVNAVPPAEVFGSIAQTLGCGLEIDPGVTAPVTVRLPNVTVRVMLNALCESIGCGWRLAGSTLRIEAKVSPKPGRVTPESFRKILQQQTPPDFQFQNTPLKDVLGALGKTAGIQISADEPDASRLVTIDLGSRSILKALEVVGRSVELKSGMMIAGLSKGPGMAVKIRFTNKPAPKGAKGLPDKFKE